ncbi:MAG TPA: dihydropteroate synthase [Syntrophorhabdaceae bacterium]|nr:dihydropteroate synthase [Syntrophorhabdaceae bacterium]
MARELPSNNRPLIMGILNVTPDSFFDGGRYDSENRAVEQALALISDGADIIDVGGESTRPNADSVSVEEELARVVPVIGKIREHSDVFISVDTYKSEVAREACRAGADMINDISGLTFDADMALLAGRLGAYVVIMHIKGTPKDMQKDPHYDDVVFEINDFFARQIETATKSGVREEHIILDPGIGFGKRVEDNLRILKRLGEFKKLGRPVLVGASMKSFIGAVTGAPVDMRAYGTLAAVAVSLMNGADIVRVHDVKKTREVLQIVEAVMTS